MFDGPAEQSTASPRAYYPRPAYDLSDFLPLGSDSARNIVRTDEPSGRRFWEACDLGQNVDGVTGATLLLRLSIPSVYRDLLPSRVLAISYPPDGAVFPCNLCTPCIEWDDPHNDVWQVRIGVGEGPARWRFLCEERRWWFPSKVWRVLCGEAVGEDAWVQVMGARRGGDGRARPTPVQASRPVRFRISPDPADNVIVYRLVAPPFLAYKAPDTFVRDVRSFRTWRFLRGRKKYCFNCHTFSTKRGTSGTLAIQARHLPETPPGLRTYFGIYDIEAQRGWKACLPFDIQMTTFVAWSPDGAQLAISANQRLRTLEPVTCETQMASQATSDIAVCDLGKRVAYMLPGASDPATLELFPRWTPDGKAIVFASSPSGPHPEEIRYDLLVVPANGGRGGTPKPIPGAASNGKSNFYPRFSPDGKWFSFCQADRGVLIRSSSDIWLMPAGLDGRARRLECNADYAADSWHSWSSNSRWLVFASKRDDGVYARLYMTHIDDDGRASPAVRLPVKDSPVKTFNIPEFLAEAPRIEEHKLFEAIRMTEPAVPISSRSG